CSHNKTPISKPKPTSSSTTHNAQKHMHGWIIKGAQELGFDIKNLTPEQHRQIIESRSTFSTEDYMKKYVSEYVSKYVSEHMASNKNGVDGRHGRDGRNGERGHTGPKGDRGTDGLHGKNGIDGRHGRDGHTG